MVHKSTAAVCQFRRLSLGAFKRGSLRFLRSVGQGVGWGREEGMARRIAEKAMWMECRVQVIAWRRAKTEGKAGTR